MASPDEQRDLELLDRVLTAFALADDSGLESVLIRFLVPVIRKMGTQFLTVRKKVMAVLSHISSRIKGSSVKMPMNQLTDVLNQKGVSGFVKNFVLIYLSMAFGRLSAEEQHEWAPKLLIGVSEHSEIARMALFRICLPYFPRIPNALPIADLERQFAFCMNEADTKCFLEFSIDLLFCQYFASLSGGSADGSIYCPGLSMATLHKVMGTAAGSVSPLNADTLMKSKIFAVQLLCSDLFSFNRKGITVLPHLIVASCDPHSAISQNAKPLVKILAMEEMEDEAIMTKLFDLCSGVGIAEASSGEAVGKKFVSTPEVRHLSMSFLLKSKIAVSKLGPSIELVVHLIHDDKTTKKLQLDGLRYISWFLDETSESNIKAGAPLLTGALYKYLKETTSGEASLRSAGYTALAKAAHHAPSLFNQNSAALSDLFDSIRDEPQGARAAIQDALLSMCKSYRLTVYDNDKLRSQIELLLLFRVRDSDAVVRRAAVLTANSVFKFSHSPARFLCCCAISDSAQEVKDEARRGLKWADFRGTPMENDSISTKEGKDSDDITQPKFASFVTYSAFKSQESEGRIPEIRLNSSSQEVVLLFARQLLKLNSVDEGLLKFVEKLSEENEPAIDAYKSLISAAITPSENQNVQSIGLESLYTLLTALPTVKHYYFVNGHEWLTRYLSHPLRGARQAAAGIFGVFAHDLNIQSGIALLSEFESKLAKEKKHRSTRIPLWQGNVAATGEIIHSVFSDSQSETTQSELVLSSVKRIVSLLAVDLHLKDISDDILQYSIFTLGQICQIGGSVTPFGDSGELSTLLKRRGKALSEESEKNEVVDFSVTGFMQRLVSILDTALASKRTSIVEAVVKAMGQTCAGYRDDSLMRLVTEVLLDLAPLDNIGIDVHTAIGSALWQVGYNGDDNKGLFSLLDTICESLLEIPTTQKSKKSGSPSSAESRKRYGLTLWLSVFARNFGKMEKVPELLESRLLTIQKSFLSSLSSEDEFLRDVACSSLLYCYEASKEKKNLVSAFHRYFFIEKEGVETLVFYHDLCVLATDIGNEDCVYAMLNRSSTSHSSDLSSDLLLFDTKAVIDSSSVDKMLPKLYRYCYDPNSRVRDSMSRLWKSMVKYPRQTVSALLPKILNELLTGISARGWRIRASSALAIADAISGRSYAEVSGHLEGMWKSSLKAMDDMQDSVREACTKAVNALSSLSLRLCSIDQSGASSSKYSSDLLIPLLLNESTSNPAKESRQAAFSVMLKIVDVIGENVRSNAAELVCTLVESMSALEPEMMSYAQMHTDTDQLKISSENFAQLRVDLSRLSPLNDAVNKALKYLDEEGIKNAIPRLTRLVRDGVGLPTLAGAARVIGSIVSTHPVTVKPNLKLLCESLLSSISSHSQRPVRKACGQALTPVFLAANNAQENVIIDRLCGMYYDVERVERDPGLSISVGETLLSLATGASDKTQRYLHVLVPLVFFGRCDGEKEAKSAMEVAWEELSSTLIGGPAAYVSDILDVCMTGLRASLWAKKAQAANCIVLLCRNVVGSDLYDHIQPVLKELNISLKGRVWEGKHSIVQAASAALLGISKAIKLHSKSDTVNVARETVELMARECGRGKKPIRVMNLKLLGDVLEEYNYFNVFEPVFELLNSTVFADVFSAVSVAPKGNGENRDLELAKDELKRQHERRAIQALCLAWPVCGCIKGTEKCQLLLSDTILIVLDKACQILIHYIGVNRHSMLRESVVLSVEKLLVNMSECVVSSDRVVSIIRPLLSACLIDTLEVSAGTVRFRDCVINVIACVIGHPAGGLLVKPGDLRNDLLLKLTQNKGEMGAPAKENLQNILNTLQ